MKVCPVLRQLFSGERLFGFLSRAVSLTELGFQDKNEWFQFLFPFYRTRNFLLLKTGLIEENVYLNKIAQKLDVEFLDFFGLLCNTQKQICISTPSPDKQNFIYSDLVGHFYREGINFLSIEIAKKNWIR